MAGQGWGNLEFGPLAYAILSFSRIDPAGSEHLQDVSMQASQDLAPGGGLPVDTEGPRRVSRIRPAVQSDEAALEHAAAEDSGREARIRRLLSEYFDLVWRTACRLGATQGRADDVAQEVFLVASRRLDRVEIDRERQFLMGVTVRVAANVRRRALAKAEIAGDVGDDRHADPSPWPDELLEHKQLRQVLDGILDTLPDDQREVFVLSEIEGMTGPEVAASLDLPLGTVASRLHRARERYRTEVGRYRLRWTRTTGGAP